MSIKKSKSSGILKCEICKNHEILVTHHINGRDILNANHKSNLVDLCSNCHVAVHFGRIVIEGWVMTTLGKELFWHYQGEESKTGRNSNPYLVPGSSISEKLIQEK